MIEHITINNKIFSIIVRRNFEKNGLKFFTPNDFSQQLAYMKRPKNYVIAPHKHNAVPRKEQFTQETLFIRSGRVRVDFYDNAQNYIKSAVLEAGDVILLVCGGHGFEMLEESEIIEVKQGPYCGDMDKKRFVPVSKEKIKYED